MLTDTTITLYNKVKLAGGKELYKKTIITKNSRTTGATWHGKTLGTVSNTESGKGMLNMANNINIRIPLNNNFSEGKSYIDEKAWFKLSDTDREKYFTIQVSDKVVKGICSYEYSDTNLITKLDSFDNVATVMAKDINNYGSRCMQHLYIGGK